TLFPYTTLFRSRRRTTPDRAGRRSRRGDREQRRDLVDRLLLGGRDGLGRGRDGLCDVDEPAGDLRGLVVRELAQRGCGPAQVGERRFDALVEIRHLVLTRVVARLLALR